MSTCDCCGKDGVSTRRVTRTYGRDENLVVIENIPMATCPHCGESYFTAETLHEIERLKLHHKSLSVRRTVDVVAYG
jgi:YgiT-type zinc finger domain-containing protein